MAHAGFLILWLASPAISTFVYRVCFTDDMKKADVSVIIAGKKYAQYCTWDEKSCETADMVVTTKRGKQETFTIYLSSSRSVCR